MAGVVGAAPGADGSVATDGSGAVGESGAQVVAAPEPEVPKGPPPPPPPFDYFLDLPAEGAEVPFVKNYVPPPPEPEPVAIREDGQPTCNFISSFASHHVGVASDCPVPVDATPVVATEAPVVVAEAQPVADAPAPTTEAPPAEAPAPTTEAPPAEAAPAEAAPTA